MAEGGLDSQGRDHPDRNGQAHFTTFLLMIDIGLSSPAKSAKAEAGRRYGRGEQVVGICLPRPNPSPTKENAVVSLAEFRADTRAIQDGAWIRVNEAAYGDLDIMTRGFTDEFVDAQNARLAKAAEPYGGDRSRIPNAEQRRINATLLRDFLVIDVRNLMNDGQPVEVEAFHALLFDPAFTRLARACWDAASRVTARSQAQMEAAAGNSQPHSL
jgi:hypothetical protein